LAGLHHLRNSVSRASTSKRLVRPAIEGLAARHQRSGIPSIHVRYTARKVVFFRTPKFQLCATLRVITLCSELRPLRRLRQYVVVQVGGIAHKPAQPDFDPHARAPLAKHVWTPYANRWIVPSNRLGVWSPLCLISNSIPNDKQLCRSVVHCIDWSV
jgi:hypothetical protein